MALRDELMALLGPQGCLTGEDIPQFRALGREPQRAQPAPRTTAPGHS